MGIDNIQCNPTNYIDTQTKSPTKSAGAFRILGHGSAVFGGASFFSGTLYSK